MSASSKHFAVCRIEELPPGERLLVEIDGKSIGVFNVRGEFFALHNRCPHTAGALCEGPITGTALPTDSIDYTYGREQELIRCGWHGWEFDIRTGQCLVDQRMRARRYGVHIEDGQVVVQIK